MALKEAIRGSTRTAAETLHPHADAVDRRTRRGVLRRAVAHAEARDGRRDQPHAVLGVARRGPDPERRDPRGRPSGARTAHGRHGVRRHLHRGPGRRHRERASRGRRSDHGHLGEAQRARRAPLLRPADPAPRRPPPVDDESRPRGQRARDAVRPEPAQDGRQGPAEDHLQRRRRRGRGDRGAGGGQGVPPAPGQVPGDGREDPARCPVVRSAGDGQDAVGARGRGGGRRPVLLDQRFRLRRDVRRRRCRSRP